MSLILLIETLNDLFSSAFSQKTTGMGDYFSRHFEKLSVSVKSNVIPWMKADSQRICTYIFVTETLNTAMDEGCLSHCHGNISLHIKIEIGQSYGIHCGWCEAFCKKKGWGTYIKCLVIRKFSARPHTLRKSRINYLYLTARMQQIWNRLNIVGE